MAEITCRELETFRVDGHPRQMTPDEARSRLDLGDDVELLVDGWKEPWLCFLDETGELRAVCPTSSRVMPRVVFQSSTTGGNF